MKRSVKLLLTLFSLLVLAISIAIFFIFFEEGFSINAFYWILPIIYFLQIVLSFIIFFSKRRYEVKSAWLFILNIPIIGLISFLLMGLLPFEIKSIDKMKKTKEVIYSKEDFSFSNEYSEKNKSDPMIAALNISNSTIYEKNNLKFIAQKDLVEETVKLIRKAEKTINIEFYILSDSIWLNILTNELVKKSKEGIKIKVMFDYIGSHKKINRKFISTLKKNNIEYSVFNSTKLMKFVPNTNFRNHRKGIIVDNKYCLTGGSNIGDEYINLKKGYFYWSDVNFIIEGESVHSINLQFYYDWHKETNKRTSSNTNLINEINDLKKHQAKNSNEIIQILQSEPYSEFKIFKNIITKYNAIAKKRIWIYTPYFASSTEYIESLISASMSGVDVRIILPGKPDNKKIILSINRFLYEKLLNSNIKIYEYNGFIHTKAIIIDDDVAILGSNNLDMRSLFINFETAIIVKSEKINAHLVNSFLQDINNSNFFAKDDLNEFYTPKEKFKRYFINVFYGVL
ncbi:MAG: cardiolipin synthase [Mycoplasmoidaceae bacterium]